MLKGGLVLGGGNILGVLLSLVRNVLLARLLSVEDFGIATTFAITMAMVEMASSFSLDRMIVQDREGEDPSLLASLHSMQLARGVLGAVVLFLIAEPYARVMGATEAIWAYQLMALTPIIRALAHFDMYRVQREMRFGPVMTALVISQAASLVIGVGLALWLGDYSAMLYALIVQQAAFAGVSHLMAEGSYRLGWDLSSIRRAVGFGWPLWLNGILMFGIFYGDRTIVGNQIGLYELGWFSAAFLLTLTPANVLASTLGSLFLPQLSKARDDHERFRTLGHASLEAGLLLGACLAAGIAVLGPAILILLFGLKYEPALTVLAGLGILQGVRVARTAATPISLSQAKTVHPMVENIVRVMFLGLAFILAARGGGVTAVVMAGIAGETLALVCAIVLMHLRIGLPVSGHLGALVMFGLVIVGTGLGTQVFVPTTDILSGFHPWQLTLPLGLAGIILAARSLRASVRDIAGRSP
jgi:O-antigen/teichoic acid export membrane protein